MSKKRILFAELVLLLASVFVFRGLWMLLDSLAMMHKPQALWMSLICGAAATIWALHGLMKQEKK
jgi:hypothetical protein